VAVLTYFGEREELERATAAGSFAQERSAWSRTLIMENVVNEQDLYDTIGQIVGYTYTSVAGGKLTRLLPRADPQFRYMIADGISNLQGVGQSAEVTPAGPLESPLVEASYGLWANYDCKVNFTPAPYAVLADAQITMNNATWYEETEDVSGGSAGRAFQYANEWIRFCLMDRAPRDEYVTATQGKFQFRTGAGAAGLTGTFSSTGTAVTGAATSFIAQIKVGDVFGNTTYGFSAVSAVTSNTALTLAAALPNGNAPAGTAAQSKQGADGQAAKAQAPLYLNNADVTLTWFGVPLRYVRSDNSYFEKYKGRVNQNAWATPWKTWQPGELLYQNYSYREYVPPVAQIETDPIYGTITSIDKTCTVILKFLETRRVTADTYTPVNRNYVKGGHNLQPWFGDRKFHYGGAAQRGSTDPLPCFLSADLRILFTDPDFVQTPLAGGGKPI